MRKVIEVFIIAFAYASVVVGAGNASGMEPFFYYTSFGMDGTIGVLMATILYGIVGYFVTGLGQRLKSKNYKEVTYLIGGKVVGRFIDYLIIFMMLGTGIIMLSGSAALFKQQYDMPLWQGGLIMTSLVTITLMLRLRKIILVIGLITPILIVLLSIMVYHSLVNQVESYAEVNDYVIAVGDTLPGTLPNWWIAALNHVTMMTVAGVGMSLVIGGEEKDPKVAKWGGALGGLIIGGVLSMGHFALFSQIKVIAPTVDTLASMPSLQIMNTYAPSLSPLLTLMAMAMIYSTAVSMFYVFISRYVEMETVKSRVYILVTLVIGYGISFVGFVQLMGYFYPIAGYVGIILIGMIFYGPFKVRKLETSGELKPLSSLSAYH
ncbi:hypothetical protein GCM10007161_11710 [Ignatzschineria indica]|uniref:Branched-chain amino acid transport system carrier protein n=1 Tax=Ignatzschineria indica TaxID=472583 RepID=A0A2U2AK99_9GAMM|nr:hypothetical protein [Ignatzschineria indica]PWD83210.1 hypothetical protein DC082_07330 [Ignatzschineria indica]GGZ82070.1 hypothetical protein GCM10007161_11710 [Ignatzschineria indica]